ncbi:MAG TPA: cyclic pyranopterin monophosphate synthase MoaC [Gemmatimonadota bacterium]|nr:cyclic pyranopterin monophosphate synthase MoaC [Gemmatimonadota bacterium]
MTGPTHIDPAGRARMVDVSAKAPTRRVASASGALRMSESALAALTEGRLSKGDALAVARVAGIQAAKRTPGLIPLCHPLPLDHVAIAIQADPSLPGVRASAEVVATARTGAEMEALTAVAVALLTVYDMAKSMDRSMTIESIRLDQKAGGSGGDYVREEERFAAPGR